MGYEMVEDNEIFDYYLNELKDNKEINKFLLQNDLPVVYKELKLYPIKIKLYVFFQLFSGCLVLEQHKVADFKALSLKYLDFLFYSNKSIGIDNRPYAIALKEVLYMCLRIPRYIVLQDNKKIPTIDFILDENNHHLIKIYNKTYNAQDFDKIRTIICEQNLLEMPDPSLSQSLEKKYDEYIQHLKKTGRIKTGDFEDLSLCLMAELGYTKEQVGNLTIRTFYKLLQRVGFISESKILKLLSPNLEKKDRDKIPEWTDKIKEKSKIEEMSASIQEIEGKVNGAN